MPAERKPLVLVILDGWGYRAQPEANAIALARTPCWNELWEQCPHALLNTSGDSVGLPEGQMGNSEVGHMTIGAGRIVYQDLTRITQAIDGGDFERNPALCEGIASAITAQGTVHVMGLLSPGGVHSHEQHFLETVKLASRKGAQRISVHVFLDGRDTPPRSAEPSIRAMQALVDELPGASISTLCGRYYAMDRDQRWDRVQKAYEAIASARAAHSAGSALQALQAAYLREENDEFVSPTVIGAPAGLRPDDTVIFVNFRADRARELTRAFVERDFGGFERTAPRPREFVCMTEYLAGLPARVAFPAEPLQQLLGAVLAEHGLRQLRIAETEKYAHVTFFLNGGQESPFPLEERVLIPSPKVATYDLQPEMSLPELSRRLALEIGSGKFDVIVCNVANPDMVGHTGFLDAAIRAVEAVDLCLSETRAAVRSAGGELLITADHGNVEQMLDPVTGQSMTAHTTNPVPLVFDGRPATMAAGGTLRDIAPTMLQLLGIPQPAQMTGRSLLRLI